MKTYIILTTSVGLLTVLRKNEFSTYEEAVEFAETLGFGVTIYESIAKTNIKHEITKYEDINNSTSEPSKIPR